MLPTGKEHSTAIGVCDVWVEAFFPRSNWSFVRKERSHAVTKHTRVRRDVFPEPLGPIRRMEGNVVRPLARKTTVWRKMGIDKARIIAIASPNGEGLSKACAQSLIVDIFPGAVARIQVSNNGVAKFLMVESMQGFGG
jgi:hypothetical protein